MNAHFSFKEKLRDPEQIKIFSTNYFLKDENGKFYDDKVDKKVWLIWAEGRIHGEFDALKTPIGYIPKYDDLVKLFKAVFNKDYPREKYEAEYSIRVTKWLEKLERMEEIYRDEIEMPQKYFDELNALRERLLAAKEKHGTDVIPPSAFENE